MTSMRPTPDAYGVSEATLYNWKAKYGGMDVPEAKRLKELEHENVRLKKVLAEQMPESQMIRKRVGDPTYRGLFEEQRISW
jgi:hypothetical protein